MYKTAAYTPVNGVIQRHISQTAKVMKCHIAFITLTVSMSVKCPAAKNI